ncbi:GNAT family N-acetyltransferase [Deinococcus sonorensis]|uniref:GNAT family N-acetyltransferase n=2 Tax=Deinococcus sonorensis TaxID=309891 RepID=A0AAU7UE87_9DEIO
MNAALRPARPDDEADLYTICAATGEAGQDARPLLQHPELLGHLYAAAYLHLEPAGAWVVEDGQGVCGYVVTAHDTARFEQLLEEEWWPALRRQYPPDRTYAPADAALVQRLHVRPPPDPELSRDFPGHLHLNLLPRAQGLGLGRRLMEQALRTLHASGADALHLGVDARNTRALGFYRRMGFVPWSRQPAGTLLTRRTTA